MDAKHISNRQFYFIAHLLISRIEYDFDYKSNIKNVSHNQNNNIVQFVSFSNSILLPFTKDVTLMQHEPKNDITVFFHFASENNVVYKSLFNMISFIYAILIIYLRFSELFTK